MKVYLLNPPYLPHFGRAARWQDTGRGGTLYYPIWLSYATAVIEQRHEARLIDAPAINWNTEKVIDDIKKFEPDLLVIDSSFPSLNNDITVAESIKQNYSYDLPTVLVGPPTSQFPERILESKGIDIVAKFEYDLTLLDVAEKIESEKNLDDVKGISFKTNGKIMHNSIRKFTTSEDLDRIPFVSKTYKKHLNLRNYFLGSSLYPEVQIFTGRGCPNFCSFCSWPQTLMGRKYRTRSAPNVLDELEWIQENLPEIREVFFEDDTFTISKKRVMEFCTGYKDRRLDVIWACNARASLDYETMKEMRKANCRLLIVGYESGSDEILKTIRKGITLKQIRSFSEGAKKAGLLVTGDFIVGLPGETKETVAQTRKIIKDTKPDILQVSVASPFPGTDFYEWCKNKGYLLLDNPDEYLDKDGHQKSIISYPNLSSEEITKLVDEILKEYYLSIKYVPIALRQVLRKQGLYEMKRLLYSARMFLGYIQEKKNKNLLQEQLISQGER